MGDTRERELSGTGLGAESQREGCGLLTRIGHDASSSAAAPVPESPNHAEPIGNSVAIATSADLSGQVPTCESRCAGRRRLSKNLHLSRLAAFAFKLAIYVDDSAVPGACWPWTGGLTPDGYGRLYVGYEDLQAHRCALEVKLGRELGADEVTRHAKGCVRRCCNPEHLQPGTIADNNRDLVEHGRATRKFSADTISEIKTACAGGDWGIFSRVARRFGATPQYVRRLARGAT